LDDFNPYAPPMSSDAVSHAIGNASRRRQWMIYPAWVAAFLFNMAFPLAVAWSMTDRTGRIGMFVAAFVLVVAGCLICAKARQLAIYLVTGAIPVGLSQAVPILQIVAGSAGLAAAQVLGLIVRGDDTDRNLGMSELGGFIVTMITGGILMTMGAATGFVIKELIIKRWSRRRGKTSGQ
jgi:hypothetical protein